MSEHQRRIFRNHFRDVPLTWMAPDDQAVKPYPAEKARQGEIILRTRARRIIFFGGLVAFVVMAIILRVAF
jgi:hypothetical protein